DIRNRKTRYKSYFTSQTYSLDENLKEKRSYRSLIGISITDLYNLIGLTVIAIFVRLYHIELPTSVVFDEVHFGGFAAKYVKGSFFMDVHPPLAKLLITFAGILGGFDGSFEFKEIGDDYIEPKVPYVIMRLVSGILGIFVIPIAYLTIKLAGFSTISAFLVASLVIFENGLVTQSRLILLDSPLIAFTAFTVLMWVKFLNQEKRPFELSWWVSLAMTGVGLGITVSVKWVGLFTIAFIGLSTISGLWRLLGDLRVSLPLFIKHFLARALCLIVIPIILYMFFFVIHFAILQNTGPGDGFMTSEFQQSLRGHGMEDMPLAQLSIKHENTQGGYLHSHLHTYPTGSKQQQVTLYPHKDANNLWVIHNETDPEVPFNETNPTWIYHNAIIRLEHIVTKRRLHSHNVRPPVTDVEYQNEVSSYGYEGFPGDANDHWRVEITDYDKSDPESRERLRTLHTKFRLYHVITGCYLYSHKVKLPDWGFEQQEVTCVRGGNYKNTIWYIESNSHPKLPADAEMVNYKKPGFFKKFFELNQVMWNTNSGLTDSHPYESRPLSWMFLKRGINFWVQNNRQIYLLGNPLIWWASTFSILIFVVAKLVVVLREKRGYKDYLDGKKEHFESWSGLFFLGWCLHYLPFFLMSRQLFLHHYFPSLYFAILLIGIAFDFLTCRMSFKSRLITAIVILVASVYVFTIFSPLIYGNPWTKSECEKVKWLNTWDFECHVHHDNYEDYYAENPDVIENPDIIEEASITEFPEESTTEGAFNVEVPVESTTEGTFNVEAPEESITEGAFNVETPEEGVDHDEENVDANVRD
ncbi:2346_t:CDS:10, partial [Scutellospora calospora]